MTIIKKVKLIPWTNPYATAGLIAMWDGIWNSGSDRHLTNSSICIDVISGRHLPVQPKNDDAFIVPDSTTFKDIDLSGDMTIEWVLDPQQIATVSPTQSPLRALTPHTSMVFTTPLRQIPQTLQTRFSTFTVSR